MKRSDILAVGTVGTSDDGRPILQGWHMEGGEHFNGYDRIYGWSVDELRVISVLWQAFQFPLPLPGVNFGPAPS